MKRHELREKFVERALSETGYTARNNASVYGERLGLSGLGLPWDGAFIDVIARDVGLPLVSTIYTPTALAEFARNGRLYRKPKRGDLVFFNFSPDSTAAFAAPHVGIVVDATDWETHRVVKTVEAQTNSGLPKGSQMPDGVYKRIRHSTDVIGFGRPAFKAASLKDPASVTEVVVPARLRTGKPSRDIATVQLALSLLTDVKDIQRGSWCPKTRAAYAYFQRSIGYLGNKADGTPDAASLNRLGFQTQMFKVDGN
jgi:hypothetical protein